MDVYDGDTIIYIHIRNETKVTGAESLRLHKLIMLQLKPNSQGAASSDCMLSVCIVEECDNVQRYLHLNLYKYEDAKSYQPYC